MRYVAAGLLVTVGVLHAAPQVIPTVEVLSGSRRYQERPPQQQPSTPPPPLVSTGLIAGRVIDPASGRGVPGALVMISGGPARTAAQTPPTPQSQALNLPPPRFLTDAEGRFAFRNLTRGSYTITATKSGYADAAHGRLRPNGPTRPIVLDDGERVGEITLRLFKFASISGRVLDDAGEPIVAAQLRAYRRLLMNGRRMLTPFGGNVVTDDRGVYRLANLTPGEYVLSLPMPTVTMPAEFGTDGRVQNFEQTMQTPGGMGHAYGGAGQQLGNDSRFLLQQNPNSPNLIAILPDGRLRSSPTVFHPSARTVSEAQVVTVASGDERTGVDIIVPQVPAANISGQLISPEGPASGYALHLIPADAGDISIDPTVATAVTAIDGTFRFLAVPAGQYVMQTVRLPRNQPPPPPPPPPPPSGGRGTPVPPVPVFSGPPMPAEPLLWASAPVSVGEVDVNGLVLMLREGFKITGRADFQGSAERPQPARMQGISIMLEPADGRQRMAQMNSGRVQPDGSFTSWPALPGRYYLRVGGGVGVWSFRAAMLNGVDISDVPFELDRDITSVVLTFTDRPTDVRGTVQVPNGQASDAAVLIFPADPEQLKSGFNSRRVRMGRPGATGTFSLGQLPPGDYFIVAIREEYATEWQEPKFIEQLSRVAQRISIGEGERKNVDVTFHDVRPGLPSPAPSPAPLPGAVTPLTYANDLETATDAPRRIAAGPFVAEEPVPQVRDRAIEAKSGSSSIAGVVVHDGTNEPVRRARVTISSPAFRSPRVAVTDDGGRFSFDLLPPGRYSISAAKPAYLNAYYGARRARPPAVPIELAAGQQIANITLPMQRGGVVSGRIVDAFGEPQPNARVRLMQFVMRDGERMLQPAPSSSVSSTSGTTDDRGEYRLYGIATGSYAVAITPQTVAGNTETRQLSDDEINAAFNDLRQKASPNVNGGMHVNPAGRTIPPAPAGAAPPQTPAGGRALGYTAIYYPGTPIETEATTIAVTAGQEVSGIDVPLRLVQTTRIEGTVTGPDGAPATRASLQLVSQSGTSTTTTSMRMFPDGRFLAFGVAPGRYTLVARMGGSAPPPPPPAPGAMPMPRPEGSTSTQYWAQQEIQVNGEETLNVPLTLAEGMTLSGRIVIDAAKEKPPELGRTRVILEVGGIARPGMSTRTTLANGDGTFTITGITPGKYRLNASVPNPTPGPPSPPTTGAVAPTWMVRSALVSGRDAVDYPIDISPGQNIDNAVITLTDRVGELSGSILDRDGKPVPDLMVIVFPVDRQMWGWSSRRMRAPIRAADGKFRFVAMHPGEYFFAVLTEVEPTEFGDPAYMEQLAAASIRITIAEGEKKVQDVKIGG